MEDVARIAECTALTSQNSSLQYTSEPRDESPRHVGFQRNSSLEIEIKMAKTAWQHADALMQGPPSAEAVLRQSELVVVDFETSTRLNGSFEARLRARSLG